MPINKSFSKLLEAEHKIYQHTLTRFKANDYINVQIEDIQLYSNQIFMFKQLKLIPNAISEGTDKRSCIIDARITTFKMEGIDCPELEKF